MKDYLSGMGYRMSIFKSIKSISEMQSIKDKENILEIFERKYKLFVKK